MSTSNSKPPLIKYTYSLTPETYHFLKRKSCIIGLLILVLNLLSVNNMKQREFLLTVTRTQKIIRLPHHFAKRRFLVKSFGSLT